MNRYGHPNSPPLPGGLFPTILPNRQIYAIPVHGAITVAEQMVCHKNNWESKVMTRVFYLIETVRALTTSYYIHNTMGKLSGTTKQS